MKIKIFHDRDKVTDITQDNLYQAKSIGNIYVVIKKKSQIIITRNQGLGTLIPNVPGP